MRAGFFLRTRCSVFLMDIFCAFTKLSTATEMAKSISSARTYSRRAMRALASAIRIILSRCRTVIGKEPVASDSRRRSAKSRASFSESRSYSFGRTLSRAYTIYVRRRSCGMSCSYASGVCFDCFVVIFGERLTSASSVVPTSISSRAASNLG